MYNKNRESKMQKETKSLSTGTSKPGQLDCFNLYLQLPSSELIWELGDIVYLSPDEIDFLINPRRLRGSDFLMRWAQGRWSDPLSKYHTSYVRNLVQFRGRRCSPRHSWTRMGR
jgi:hypothetical protein